MSDPVRLATSQMIEIVREMLDNARWEAGVVEIIMGQDRIRELGYALQTIDNGFEPEDDA